ncbi:ribosomal protein L1 [Testicularia cyperi]|uniref:Ribosomal L1 domain-containing protein 1 n=1 Tax=Testicularia cyperi TaxID=1882483 RepID=A0A317XQM0_9BASI|nr:ribosomal protein L1 [Testicularia cyperi]
MPSKVKTPVEKVPVATPSENQKGIAATNVDSAQALKAFKALAAHISSRKASGDSEASSSALPLDGPQGNLRDPSNAVYVQVTVNSLSPVKKVKPVRINLPNALHEPGSTSVCLLVKDPQREYKDLLVAEKIKSIARVVGVTKLKGKFKPYDARKALVQDHDLFLADQRIVPLVPALCGKIFFDAKKNPITVNVQKKGAGLREELESAIKCTTFLQNQGSCSTIKIGYIASHSPKQLTENLMAALPAIVSRLDGGWTNVHNIDVKTGNSAALPIWNQKLGVKTHLLPKPAEEQSEEPKSPAKSTPKKSKSPAAKKAAASPSPKAPSPRRTRSAAKRIAQDDATASPAKSTPTKKKTTSSVSRSSKLVA